MLLDLVSQLRHVQLIACARCKLRPVIEIIKKMLIGIRATGSILRQSLEYIQVSISSRGLMQAAFHHRKLVIASAWFAADLDISPQQVLRLGIFLLHDAKIGHLQQRVGIVWIGAERFLKHLFSFGSVALPLGNVSKAKQAGAVVRIQLQSFLKVLFGFIESSLTDRKAL